MCWSPPGGRLAALVMTLPYVLVAALVLGLLYVFFGLRPPVRLRRVPGLHAGRRRGALHGPPCGRVAAPVAILVCALLPLEVAARLCSRATAPP